MPFLAETLFSPSHSAQADVAATLLNHFISCRHSLFSTSSYHRSSSSPATVQSSAAALP